MRPNEFWDLTYLEFIDMARGYQDRMKLRVDELLYLAWHVEAFARTKTLPELSKILQTPSGKPKPKPKPQTVEQQMAMAKILTMAFGGKIIKK